MNLKNTKGITLVSLVITVIVLLILSSAAIEMAVSTDGLFARVKTVANMWNTSLATEEAALEEAFGIAREEGLIQNNENNELHITNFNELLSFKDRVSYNGESFENYTVYLENNITMDMTAWTSNYPDSEEGRPITIGKYRRER